LRRTQIRLCNSCLFRFFVYRIDELPPLAPVNRVGGTLDVEF
jgi:hypothetical protein